MRFKQRPIGIICAVIYAVMLANVCAVQAESPPSASPLYEPRPQDRTVVDESATLRCRLRSEPSSFNPILMFTAIDAQFEYLIWDRPFVLNEKLEWTVNRAVVEAFEFSDDQLQATLVLKPGLRWQDGEPMTAADIVFSWQRILDDNVLARKTRHGTDQITQCKALDPQRVQFTFQEALATNKWSVDFPIVPKHVYEPLGDDDPTMQRSEASVRANRDPVGNGPYRVAEWVSAERIVLDRWEGYAGPKPAFAKIVFRVIPDNNAALLAFETGEIDEMSLAPRQFAEDTGGQRFKDQGIKIRGKQWTNYYIGWNTRGQNGFLSDARVRNALGLSVNRPLINERVFFGLFEESSGFFPEAFTVFPASTTGFPASTTGNEPSKAAGEFDLSRAAMLLDAAGWRISEEDGWRYRQATNDPSGDSNERAGFVLNLVTGSQTSPRVADIFQADLRRLGVEMKTQTLEWSVFNERNLAHQFNAFLSAWTCGPDPDEARNLFHSAAVQNGRNYVGYQNPEVDALFDRGVRETDAAIRVQVYRKIEQTILDDEPYTFLVEAPTLWAFGNRLRGVSLSPRGPLHSFPGIRGWWTPRAPQPIDDETRTGLPRLDTP
jgi:peptide/nickel transport system substrate-binding protein